MLHDLLLHSTARCNFDVMSLSQKGSYFEVLIFCIDTAVLVIDYPALNKERFDTGVVYVNAGWLDDERLGPPGALAFLCWL